MNLVLDRFINFYKTYNCDKPVELSTLYHDEIEFIDPTHHLHGLKTLEQYFNDLNENARDISFHVETLNSDDLQSFIQWDMTFVHPKLAKGHPVQVTGISHIKYDNKIFYHRDFFDMGQMIYEHVPVVGSLVRFIKGRL